MSARVITINARLTRYQDNLAPGEQAPAVKVFLDRDCDRVPVEVPLNTEDAAGVYDVKIVGQALHPSVHNMFAIGFKSYFRTTSEQGIPVKTDAGQDFILIRDVLEAHGERRDYTKEIELRMLSVDNYMKGRFEVTIPYRGGLDMGGVQLDRPKTLASRFIGANPEQAKMAAQPMMAYIMKTLQVREQLMDERSETHARIRMPAYLGGAGLELTRGIPLPAAAFMLYEVPKTNELFWQNAFRKVMRRDGHALSDWNHLDIGEKAQVMKETICYLPEYLPYNGDRINKNTRFKTFAQKLILGAENMESALEKGGGDCEDLTQAEGMGLEAFVGMQFDERTTHPALKEMQEIARNYTAGMVLCSVTSAAVGGADDSNAHLGAHMMDLLIPNHTLKEMVTRADAKVAARLPFDKRYMRDDLPVMEAEGTGIYFSRKNAMVGAQVREDLFREPCFAAMKTPIYHEFGTRSPFYREAMTMFVPDFARRGAGYIGFWFRDAKDNMRGVKFEDLENQRPNAQLVPHPEIPADVMAQMEEDVKIRVPPEPLVITGDITAIENTPHPEAQRIVDTVASWHRQSSDSREDFPAAVYTRHNWLDAKGADGIIETLKRKQGVYKVTYETEPLMDGESPGLRFLIWDDVSRSRPMYVIHDVGASIYHSHARAEPPISIDAKRKPGEMGDNEEDYEQIAKYRAKARARFEKLNFPPPSVFAKLDANLQFMLVKDLDHRSIQALCNASAYFARWCDGRIDGLSVWDRVRDYRYGPALNTIGADPLTVLRAHAFMFSVIDNPSQLAYLKFPEGRTPLPVNYLVFKMSADDRQSIVLDPFESTGGSLWPDDSDHAHLLDYLIGFITEPWNIGSSPGVTATTGDETTPPELRFAVNSPDAQVARWARAAFVDFVISAMNLDGAHMDDDDDVPGAIAKVREPIPTAPSTRKKAPELVWDNTQSAAGNSVIYA